MDAESGEYNRPFLSADVELVPGYRRLQGIVFRRDDPLLSGCGSALDAVAVAIADPNYLMINRNAGSGTRILIDRVLLKGARPAGYWSQPKSHNAVAVAVAQRRVDWGVTIESVAREYGLGFLPVQEEHYDFILPRARAERPAVRRFVELLDDKEVHLALAELRFSR
jgi:putative molybdopterin biosynthesis protein